MMWLNRDRMWDHKGVDCKGHLCHLLLGYIVCLIEADAHWGGLRGPWGGVPAGTWLRFRRVGCFEQHA